jgi:hypothetical protein
MKPELLTREPMGDVCSRRAAKLLLFAVLRRDGQASNDAESRAAQQALQVESATALVQRLAAHAAHTVQTLTYRSLVLCAAAGTLTDDVDRSTLLRATVALVVGAASDVATPVFHETLTAAIELIPLLANRHTPTTSSM